MGKVVVKGKRVIRVDGKVFDLGDMWLSDFIRPEDCGVNAVVLEAWRRVHEDYVKDPEGFAYIVKHYGLEDIMLKEVWNVVIKEISYRYDKQLFDVADFWQLPNETWSNKFGDCEDTTFLTESALQAIIRGWKLSDVESFAVVGLYRDVNGQYYGHAFALLKLPKVTSNWLWVETTLDQVQDIYSWLVADFSQLIPVYFTNGRSDYRVDRDYGVLGLSKDYYLEHKDAVDELINYVESGVRTTFKWMHKGRRAPTVTPRLLRLATT